MSNPSLNTEGLEIEVYRSKGDRRLVIDIATGDLGPLDTHPRDDIPNIKIIINESTIEIAEDGSYIVDGEKVEEEEEEDRCDACGKTVAACNAEKDAIQDHNERGGL